MLNKILVASAILLLVGKLFFKPQLAALKTWFDGVINALLIAIAIVYAIQILLWITPGTR